MRVISNFLEICRDISKSRSITVINGNDSKFALVLRVLLIPVENLPPVSMTLAVATSKNGNTIRLLTP
jgi:hypothetical protein